MKKILYLWITFKSQGVNEKFNLASRFATEAKP